MEGKEHHEKKSHDSGSKTSAASSDVFWKVTTGVLIVLLAILVFRTNAALSGLGGAAAPTAPSAAAPSAAAPTVDMEALIDDDYVLGDPNAPVTIVEFSDYECPFCGRFYTQTLSQIKAEYIESGQVKLVYRDFPLSFHPEAQPAAIAANCAGEQGMYYEYHDLLFENQAALSASNYELWAQELGLDMTAWTACLDDPAQAAEVQKDFRDGGAAGVQGTPAFFINGKLISGAQPYQVFQAEIEAALN